MQICSYGNINAKVVHIDSKSNCQTKEERVFVDLYYLTGDLFLTTNLSRKFDPCQKVGFGKILSDDIQFFLLCI